jgi:TIR domain
MSDRLCICGRSKTLPFCDNSHISENWSCAVEDRWSDYGFSASGRYQNLALKLSAHFGGLLVLPSSTRLTVDTLVTILDGTDLNRVLISNRHQRARRQIVVTLGVDPGLLATPFPQHEIHSLGDVDILQAFKRIRQLLEDPPGPQEAEKKTIASCFLSHAVKDEPLIQRAVEYLRDFYGADFFLCGDSIQPGDDWFEVVSLALREKERFVVFLSEWTLKSHFVSFEIGVASALEKPIILLSLDGSYPPSFLQHLQFVDLPRLRQQKPWLSIQDIQVDELLRALGSTETDWKN